MFLFMTERAQILQHLRDKLSKQQQVSAFHATIWNDNFSTVKMFL